MFTKISEFFTTLAVKIIMFGASDEKRVRARQAEIDAEEARERAALGITAEVELES